MALNHTDNNYNTFQRERVMLLVCDFDFEKVEDAPCCYCAVVAAGNSTSCTSLVLTAWPLTAWTALLVAAGSALY